MRATLETGFVLILGATLVACGGGSSPSGASDSLSAVGRLAIAQQIVTTALGGVVLVQQLRRTYLDLQDRLRAATGKEVNG